MPTVSTDEKFYAKVDSAEPLSCWLWTAAKNRSGYGCFNVGTGVVVLAHRWVYQHLIGEIPAGLELDHLCHERACVNPWHLDPVTRQVNNSRQRQTVGERNAAKTHCPRGHAYDQRNTRWSQGRRWCRACDNARTHRRHKSCRNGANQ